MNGTGAKAAAKAVRLCMGTIDGSHTPAGVWELLRVVKARVLVFAVVFPPLPMPLGLFVFRDQSPVIVLCPISIKVGGGGISLRELSWA